MVEHELPSGTVLRKIETKPFLSNEGDGRIHLDALIVHGKNWMEYPPSGVKLTAQRFNRQLRRWANMMPFINLQLNEPKDFKLKLSYESKLTAIAAAMLYIQGITDVLIFSTGKTAGKKWPSEAEAMVEYVKARFPQIPYQDDPEKGIKSAIRLEDISYDTPGNIIESKKIIEREGLQSVGYLTIGPHLPRVEFLMDYYNLPISVIFPSEEVVRGRSGRHRRWVDTWKKSKRHNNIVKVEQLLIAESAIDPGQKLLSRFVTSRVRHQ